MATLEQIREGLKANLAAITGVQVSAYMLAQPTPPAICVFPGPIDYDQAMARGVDKWMLTIRAFAGLTSDEGAQIVLDRFLAPSGATSVKQAAESDKTLDGVVASVRVVSCTGYGVYQFEGRPPLLGADWSVEIYATGT